MAREVQAQDPRAVWYTPECFGNRKDPKPIRVLIAPLTAEQYAKMTEASFGDISQLSEGSESMAERGRIFVDSLLRQQIRGVENYSGRKADGSGVIVPKNGAELLDLIYMLPPEELELRTELAEAMRNSAKLREGLEKNSDTPPASSARAATSQPEDGLAPNAGAAAGMTPISPPQLS